MSTFVDWHFCHEIQLSPAETASYLDMLAILRSRSSDCMAIEKALTLLGAASSLQQAYALPLLIENLYCREEYKWMNGQADELAQRKIVRMLRRQMISCLDYSGEFANQNREKPVNHSAELTDFIDRQETVEQTKIKYLLGLLERAPEAVAEDRSYLRTDHFCEEIAVLSILQIASRQDTQVIERVEEIHPQLFESFYKGNYGMLPKQLALLILGNTKKDFAIISAYFPNDWLLYPEYMRLAAQTVFFQNTETELEALMGESCTLEFYQKNCMGIHQTAEPIWFSTITELSLDDPRSKKRARRERQNLSAILWQAVLWERAAEISPDEAVKRLNSLWQTPQPVPSNNRIEHLKQINELYRLRKINMASQWLANETNIKIFFYHNGQSSAASVISTPWQLFGGQINPYRDMKGTLGALRAFTALCILRTLLEGNADCLIGATGEKPIQILRLLLNFGAAFGSPWARREWESSHGRSVWSYTLYGLGLYANGILASIGTGECAPLLPGELWGQLGKIRKDQGNSELRALANQQGLLICAGWVYHAQLSVAVSRKGHALTSPWEDYKRSLCEKLFSEPNELPPPEVRNHAEANWLYYTTGLYSSHQQCPFHGGYWYETGDAEAPSSKTDTCTLLRTEPTKVGLWREITLREEDFTPEAWLIVLTLRIQGGLAEGRVPAEWIRPWRDALFLHAQIREHLTLFPVLIDVLRVPAPDAGDTGMDRKLYDLILDTVIEVVDLNVSEKTVFYLCDLMRALAGAEKMFGTTTLANGCANLLLSLDGRPADEPLWQELKLYLLQQLAKSSTSLENQITTVTARLNKHLLSRCESRKKKHYVIHEVKNDWNPLTDHFLQCRDGKYIVSRRRLKLHGANLFNGFVAAATRTEQQTKKLGLICRRRDFYRDGRDNQKYFLHTGGDQLVEKEYSHQRPDDKYMTGDLVQFDERGIQEVYLDQASERDLFSVRIQQISTSKGAELEGSLPRPPLLNLKEKSEVIQNALNYWAPDTLAFSNGVYQAERNTPCMVVYRTALKSYIPLERDFFRLLLDEFYARGAQEAVTLCYIESEYLSGGDGALFSVRPGFNYRLFTRDWDTACFAELKKNVFEQENALGIKVPVRLSTEGDFPHLYADTEKIDRSNQQWAELFDSNDVYTAMKSLEHQYCVQCDWNGNERLIPVELGARAAYHEALNVELAENGWSLTQQRIKRALMTPCSTHYVRLVGNVADQRETIRKILQIKPGDIFTFSGSSSPRGKFGYFSANIPSLGLRVECSLESLAFCAQSPLPDALIQNRFCIVENIGIKNKNLPRHPAAPFHPQMEIEGDALEGIITEIAVRAGANRENQIVKAAFLDGDGVLRVDIPYTAFELPPRNAGDVVSLRRAQEGWVAAATWRTINVRALWQGEHHRGGKMTGEYLGLIRLPDQPLCCTTQDTNRPVLHFWPQTLRRDNPDRLCGIPIAEIDELEKQPPVLQKSLLYSDWGVFPKVRWRSVVCLNYKGHPIWGEAAAGDFENGSSHWKVEAEITKAGVDPDGKPLYDIRRIFRPRFNKENLLRVQRSQEEDKKSWYDAWYRRGDLHLFGTVCNGKFHLSDREFPPTREGSYTDRWLTDLPFCDEEPLWYKFSKNTYLENYPARVKMLNEDDRWIASCRQADPFSVNETLLSILGAVSEEILDRYTLYFAGPAENEQLRFEWGYGYTLLVSSENVVDMNNGIIGQSLFYGDYVTRFMIRQDRGVWKLYLDLDSLHKSVERRIWYDVKINNIVQLLRVAVIKEREKEQVHILSVSLSEGQIGSTEKYLLGWEWRTTYNSSLDEESKLQLLMETDVTSERCILATLRPNGTRGEGQKQLVFHYLSLQQGDTHAAELSGKRICFVAGEVRSNFNTSLQRLGNDYFLDFYLPTELPQQNEEQDAEQPTITVSVMRRNFSLDESKLRTCFANSSRDFYGQHMLVTLLSEDGDNSSAIKWQGSVVDRPLRSTDSLKNWVRSQPACIVSLGNPLQSQGQTEDEAPQAEREERLSQVCVEVAPGILSRIPKDSIIGKYHAGAIAQLCLEDDQLKAHILLPSDQAYFPQEGRAAELLVMDAAAKQFVFPEQYCQRQISYNFTVASFPQIRIKSPYIDDFMAMPWPRIGCITHDGPNWSISDPKSDAQPTAALLEISSQTNQPQLKYLGNEQKIQPCQWSELSFMDGRCAEVADTVRSGVWHYHDKCYALSSTDQRWNVRQLPDGKDYRQIVVFPTPDGHLRIHSRLFRKYGYSAHELAEYGLPHDRTWFPIAGVVEDSIWIEVYPNRIVELPKAFLFIGKQKQSLHDFALSLLSAGDEIALKTDFGFKGGQRRFTVTALRYGIRSNLPAFGFAFLPIQEIYPDGVLLGSASWQMTYPCTGTADLQECSVVALSQENQIVLDRMPQCGDTVFVRFERESLKIEPEQEMPVIASEYDSHWPGALWLRNWMRDYTMRRRLFSALKCALPLEIKYIQRGRPIFVGYSQPEERCYPVGTFLYSTALGLVEEDGIQYVILRAGRLLLHVPYEQLLPGFPLESAKLIVDHLRDQHTGIWLHKTEDSWKTGVNDQPLAGREINVYLLDWIGEAHGILCCSEEKLSLLWLPIQRAAFVRLSSKDSTSRERHVWEALKKSCQDRQHDPAGEAALLASQGIKRAYLLGKNEISLVDPGSISSSLLLRARLRAIPLVKMESRSMTACIAELYPQGDLIELYSEFDDFTWDTPQPIIVSKISQHTIQAVIEGFMRERIRLCQTLCDHYYEAWNSSGEDTACDYLPANALQNQEIFFKASMDAQNRNITDLSTIEGTLESKLVYLYSFQKTGQALTHTWFQQSFGYLNLWLNKAQTIQLLGAGAAKRRYPEESFCEFLTAVLLMRSLGTRCKNMELRGNVSKLAVHTARMLGIACQASIQQEIILNCIKAGDNGGLWKQLYKIDLRGTRLDGEGDKTFYGTLNQHQHRQLLRTCEYILRRSNHNDTDLLLTAESLLYAVGRLEDFNLYEMHLDEKRFELLFWKFARIGRTLTPRDTNLLPFDAIPEELNWQIKRIWDTLQGQHFVTAPLYLDSMDENTSVPFTETQKREINNLVQSCRDGFAQESQALRTP